MARKTSNKNQITLDNFEYNIEEQNPHNPLTMEYPEGYLIPPTDILYSTNQQVNLHKDKLKHGVTLTFKDFCTEEYWASLSEHDRIVTNLCVSFLIRYEELPLKVIGYLTDATHLYERK